MPHKLSKYHGGDDTRRFYLITLDSMTSNMSVARYLIVGEAIQIP